MYTSTIVDRCTQKLVDDWNAMRCQVGFLRRLDLFDTRNTWGRNQTDTANRNAMRCQVGAPTRSLIGTA